MTRFMKAAFVAGLLTSAALALAAPARAGADLRLTWVYSEHGGGRFENTIGSYWVEVSENARFQFREVERTAAYVQLYDASRDTSVRLYDTVSYVRFPGSGGWQPLYRGYWRR